MYIRCTYGIILEVDWPGVNPDSGSHVLKGPPRAASLCGLVANVASNLKQHLPPPKFCHRYVISPRLPTHN